MLHRVWNVSAAAGVTLTLLVCASSNVSAASCEALASSALPHTTITLAETVAAGAFKLPTPATPGRGPRFDDLPSFCRVAAISKPSADSEIKIEVWLPVSNWNSKFQATGNGCWAAPLTMGRWRMCFEPARRPPARIVDMTAPRFVGREAELLRSDIPKSSRISPSAHFMR